MFRRDVLHTYLRVLFVMLCNNEIPSYENPQFKLVGSKFKLLYSRQSTHGNEVGPERGRCINTYEMLLYFVLIIWLDWEVHTSSYCNMCLTWQWQVSS